MVKTVHILTVIGHHEYCGKGTFFLRQMVLLLAFFPTMADAKLCKRFIQEQCYDNHTGR